MKITKLLCWLALPALIVTACGKDNLTIVTPVVTPITITDFYPQKMITGRELTIIGTNFDAVAANNVVKINGVDATVVSSTATTIIVTIPTAATSGKITVNKGALSATSSTGFTVMNNPYQNVRIKSIYNQSTKRSKLFFYDSVNRLTSVQYYATNALGVEFLESSLTYVYLGDGKLEKDIFQEISPASKITYINRYAYVNEVLSTITRSNVNATNAATVTTVTDIIIYDFLKGAIDKLTYLSNNNSVTQVNKYSYSIVDGNPKAVVTVTKDASAQSPVLSTTTTIEYADVLSPLSLVIPSPSQQSFLLAKSQALSGVIGAYNFTYTLDAFGKIATTTITQALAGISTETYTYENRN